MKFSTSKTLQLGGNRTRIRNDMMNVSNYKKELFPWKKIKILLTSMDEEKNIIFPGILDIVQNEQLEETIKFILSDIGIKLDVNDIEDSHRVGKPD